MVAAILSCWALLLGLGLLMLGNGLQGSLLGLRATFEGFPTATTGVVMTGYFAGFLIGSWIVPRMVRHVGHVRVFAALASLASVAVLAHSALVHPAPWFAMRVVSGVCMAGLYLVTESWLNDIATNRTRGQLLSVYMVIMMAGVGLGQLLLNVADPRGHELFVLISVLISLALVPMLLSASRAPEFSAPQPLGLVRLFRASPLGLAGSVSTGLAQGSFFAMGTVFASNLGLGVAEVSLLMTGFALGAVALQWPLGWLSDHLDRRKVIVATTAASTALALAALAAARHSPAALIVVITLYGGVSIPLYSLFIAHTNDHLQPSQRVAASASLVFSNGVGSVLGPVLCAAIMSTIGDGGFLLFLAANHGVITLYGLWRMLRRESVARAEQHAYPPMAPRGTAIAAAEASRTVREHDDGETGEWTRL